MGVKTMPRFENDAKIEQLRQECQEAQAKSNAYPAHIWLKAEAMWAESRYERAVAARQPSELAMQAA
jgi:hypothetical protein